MKIRRALASDSETLSQMATESFMAAVAPHYDADGIAEFTGYASEERIAERLTARNIFYLVEGEGQALAMAEFLPPDHLTMLFVLPGHQRRHIGRVSH